MGTGCLLRYNEERGVVCRKFRKEFLSDGIQGRGSQGSHFLVRVSVAEAMPPQDRSVPELGGWGHG